MARYEPQPIAIIGMGCRYPGGANSPEKLWNMLAQGQSAWTDVPPDRFNHKAFYHPEFESPGAINQKGGHFLDQDIAAFDAGFFGIAPFEAETMDPQQRVVLETAWEAVENAGIPLDKLAGSMTGVFVAMFGHDFEQISHKDPISLTKYHNLGVAQPLLANRVSYVFNLHGPSVMLDTACSGSLVAVNSACQSLCSGEASMALAGGVGLIFSPDQMALMSMTGVFNDEGKSFAFDDRGKGYGRAEGVGIIALKRLDDALRDGDNIRAVIRSSGVNSDGRTNGIMQPSQSAQERLSRSQFRHLPFTPADVQYVEAHGTGTKAGDQVEMNTIRNVFCLGRDKNQPLFIGGTKPNIGHSEAASGAAGLIKTVMSMEKGLIPPISLLENFKPGLSPNGWNMEVPRSLTAWPQTPSNRRAVVNSFGFGGTNAVVVLESLQLRSDNKSKGVVSSANRQQNGLTNHDMANENKKNPPRLFTISAKSEYSLQQTINDLKSYVEQQSSVSLDDLSYTLTNRRSKFPWRSSLVAENVESLAERLSANHTSRKKTPAHVDEVFIFTGQGAQWATMGRSLLMAKKPNEFQASILRSEEALKALGAQWSLIEELSREEASSRLHDSHFGQPGSTAVQIALVDLLGTWGVKPTAVIGHSSGEIAAAYASGAISQSAAMRVSYHRGFLAQMSKQRASQPGTMMAVGLGPEDAQEYIRKSGSDRIIVACVNSPSSTTISGDETAILDLRNVLTADGIFNRLLKVDTAYHSHHMKLVCQDYLAQLDGLETGFPASSVRFFSTVTGEAKSAEFDASYWVLNLVSPVQFSAALQALSLELGKATLNLIEIGPHNALSGPVRQTLAASQEVGLSYNYVPTLVRGFDSLESIQRTGATLFDGGSDVDIGTVASLTLPSSPAPMILRDLPPYHWDHNVNYWAESRLSREHRCRTHPAHDLLGTRVIVSPGTQPSWRILLSTETLPWLREHVVDSFIVFPGAGYMAMAIEAVRQFDEDRNLHLKHSGYRLKNVDFKKTLTVPKDNKKVEVVTTLHCSDSEAKNAWTFHVSSVSEEGKWQVHCEGLIETVPSSTGQDEIGQRREEAFSRQAQASRLRSARETCTKITSHDELYAQMAAMGNRYGPSFAAITQAYLSAFQSLSFVTVPDIRAGMPGKFMQPHVVHPATLDAVIQAGLPLFQQHSVRGSVMLTLIGELFISSEMINSPGQELQVICNLAHTSPHSTGLSVAVFQVEQDGEERCVLTLDSGEIRVVGESQSTVQQHASDTAFKLQWGIDSCSVTAEMLESVKVPLQSDEAGISPAEKVRLGSLACARYIDSAVNEMQSRNLTVKDDHRVYWWTLLQEFVGSEAGQQLIQLSPKSKQDLDDLTSKLGVEGEAIARFGPQLVALLSGQTDPLTLYLKDDLLFRVYHSDEVARPNRYLADYVKTLTFQRRDLKILEIGAGTGGTTFQVLQACSPNGESFCEEYMYTDISSGFFEGVRTSKLKKWTHLLKFQTLDLEQNPAEQGFEACSYDLVIAANVVHATRLLKKSLEYINRLLKPGGHIGLVEVTRATPYLNMTFGATLGWWAGVDEGRTRSPLQSTAQWDDQLRRTGFSGVDLAAYDLPEPERHCAFLLSTATSVENLINDTASGLLKIINAVPTMHPASSFTHRLVDSLSEKGLHASVWDWKIDFASEAEGPYVIVESSQRPLLTQSSSQEFEFIRLLLSKEATIYWISLGNGTDYLSPDNALVAGLSRSARNENPHLDFFTLDVQDSLEHQAEQILKTTAELIASTEFKIARKKPREFELMYRQGKLQIQRLVPDHKLLQGLSLVPEENRHETVLFHQEGRPLRIAVGKPGLLNSLVFVDDDCKDLAADEVEIKSCAWGLNFADVFIALGQLPPTRPMVGESAGIITAVGSKFASEFKPGDRVTAMFGTPYASRTRANGYLVHAIPDYLSFQSAASIPLTFATAYYSLFDCANLQVGQSILIHSGSGALGQVAIKIAQQVGATIFTTVGSASKRQILMNQYGIPESHIFSSRTTDFAAGVKRLTNGAGVDVVLNSLSGPMLHASWECVAAFGTFVEVGKRDIAQHGQLSMKPFERNLRFASVDLVLLSRERPSYCQQLLRTVFAALEAGTITLLPITTVPIGDIEVAFRLVQSRSHTGKIVLEATDTSTVRAKTRPLRLDARGTYIIAGGLGSLGRHLCRHIQEKGAMNIVLLTRKQLESHVKCEMERELTHTAEAAIKILTCDIGDASVVSQVAKAVKDTMPRVRGLFHSGVVLSDRTISQITQTDFEIVLHPKYHGTMNLYNAFANESLDFFINMSSLCGVVGRLGQANYAAGGAYQDMFSHAQLSAGHSEVITLDLPLLESTLAVTEQHTYSLARQGVSMLPVHAVWPVIDYAISGQASKDGNHQIAFGLDPRPFVAQSKEDIMRVPPLLSHVVSSHGRGPERLFEQEKEQTVDERMAAAATIDEVQQIVLDAVCEKVSSLTAVDSEELELDAEVGNMALDSLIATEVKNWITNSMQAPIQLTDILDAPSLRSLATFITNNSDLVKIKADPEQENAENGTTNGTLKTA